MVLHASQPSATPFTLIVAFFVFRSQAMAIASPTLHVVICRNHTSATRDSSEWFELLRSVSITRCKCWVICPIKLRWKIHQCCCQIKPALAFHLPLYPHRVRLSHRSVNIYILSSLQLVIKMHVSKCDL